MTDNVVPIRPTAQETIDLHRGLIEAIAASGVSFKEAVEVIRRNDNYVTEGMLASMENLHDRMVSLALKLAQEL